MHRLRNIVRPKIIENLLPGIRAASGSKFLVFQQEGPISSRQRHSSVAGSRDARFYPTCSLAA